MDAGRKKHARDRIRKMKYEWPTNERERMTERGRAMDEQWHTVTDAGDRLGIPVETIRRYIRTHGHHLKVRKHHKKYQIHDDCLETFRTIRNLYASGQNQEEIDRALDQKGIARTITIDPDDHDRLDQIMDKLDKQEQINQALIKQMADMMDQITRQNEYIKNSIDARDQNLMALIRESQQAKITAPDEQKPGIWARLFRR